MLLTNIKVPAEQVSFLQAVRQGLGRDQGLFFPTSWPKPDIAALLNMSLVQRSSAILQALIGDELSAAELSTMVSNAFTFPAPLVPVADDVACLELFHGPTLAFKDFGGRFMAQALAKAQAGKKTTIVTATSGDTGAAVAHAFYRQPGVQVVILFPKGKISPLQEKLFTTLGENITTLAVDGDFDEDYMEVDVSRYAVAHTGNCAKGQSKSKKLTSLFNASMLRLPVPACNLWLTMS